jgi:hypothetical protein
MNYLAACFGTVHYFYWSVRKYVKTKNNHNFILAVFLQFICVYGVLA